MATATNWLGVDGSILTQEVDYRYNKLVGHYVLTNRQSYAVYVQLVVWHTVNPNLLLHKSSDFKTHWDNGQWVKHEGQDMWEETYYVAFPAAINSRPWIWIENGFSVAYPVYWEIRSERLEPDPPRPYPSPVMYAGEEGLKSPWLGKLITESFEGEDAAAPDMTPLFPASGSRYDLYTYIDGVKVRLYHQLLNFEGNLYPWTVTASGSGDYYLSQSTPNGSGYLDIVAVGSGWELSWAETQPVYRWFNFVRKGSGFVIELEPGENRFVGRPVSVASDGSAYGGASKSVSSRVVSSSNDALIWNFVLVP